MKKMLNEKFTKKEKGKKNRGIVMRPPRVVDPTARGCRAAGGSSSLAGKPTAEC
jgi:hypothetical protein